MYRVSRNGSLLYTTDHEQTAIRDATNLAAASQPGEIIEVHMGASPPYDLVATFPGSSHTFGECGVMAGLTAAVAVCVGLVEAIQW